MLTRNQTQSQEMMEKDRKLHLTTIVSFEQS